ncbi:hypothetical protein NMG60_11007656 [Bertholletia excelsa]
MGSFSLNQQVCQGTTDEVELEVEAGFDSISSSSSSEVSSTLSSESELGDGDDADEATSPGPLQDMSSLMEQLPIKRGLSKFFHGKSQSFTTLSNVRSLEDLAKPENPYNKKLKSCKSYGGLLSQSQGSEGQLPRTSSSQRLISKKPASRASCSSFGAKRTPSFLGNRPPVPPPRRSTSTAGISTQTPLFA